MGPNQLTWCKKKIGKYLFGQKKRKNIFAKTFDAECMCKCGLYYIRGAITTHNKKDEHQLYILKLNVIHLEQKIYYKNKNYEIIYDNHEIIENGKIQARINYKKNIVDIVCECGAPLKSRYYYDKHITSDKHKKKMEEKYRN